MALPIVIIGTGLAGYNLAREFRQLDQDSELVLISRDGAEFYSKPLFSNALSQGLAVEQIMTSSAEHMAEQLQAKIYSETEVTAINPAEHWLEFAGQRLAYRKLVLALGAEPWIPPLQTEGLIEIHSVNDLPSYARLRQALPRQQRVLILGAGLIGCEIANDLLLAGHQALLVAPCAWPLPEQLPELVATALQTELEAAGAQFYLNTSVHRLTQQGAGYRAELANGQQLQVDTIITAAGLRPRTTLASQAGLVTAKGIVVNRQLQTSAPDIYALGDCVELEGLNLQYILPLMAEVRALAKTLAGQPTTVAYGPMPTVVKTPALPIVFAGRAPADAQWLVEGSAPHLSLQYREQEQLLAYVVTGERQRERLRLNRQLPFVLPALPAE